jgi:hypothetical protein
MIKWLYKAYWKLRGYLKPTDKIVRIIGYRDCVIDTVMGSREITHFCKPKKIYMDVSNDNSD